MAVELEADTNQIGRIIIKNYGRDKVSDILEVSLRWGHASNQTQGLFLHTCLSLAVVRTALRTFHAYWALPFGTDYAPDSDELIVQVLNGMLWDPDERSKLKSKTSIQDAVSAAGRAVAMPSMSIRTMRRNLILIIERCESVVLPDELNEDAADRRSADGRAWTLADEWWERLTAAREKRRKANQDRQDQDMKEQMDRFHARAEADSDEVT